MRLPIRWLQEYLDAELTERALNEACARREVRHADELARTLGLLLTFAGFEVEEIRGAGLDAVLELSVLANRPDAQGVLGLAREVAALLGVGVKEPPCGIDESPDAVASFAKVDVEASAHCPRYTARVIRGVKVGPSPRWLQERLESMGLVPRNNVVDVTNYVLFELNQPLHAFDLHKLAGRRIVVRAARAGEAFKPLYGELSPLTPETVVIADAEKPVAIGGIIGGAGSEVDAGTTDLLLESAYFDPSGTRRSCRRLKAGTDSSYRFERGVDIERVDKASARAARLILEVAGGTLARGLLDSNPRPRTARLITLRFAKLNALYGVEVPPAEARRILLTLGCAVREETPAHLVVQPPSWRRGDLEREVDLIEEVARLYGYHRIPAETALRARIPQRSPREVAAGRVRDLCAALGYFECWTDTLVDPAWPAPALWTKDEPLALDPRSVLSADHSRLRTSLLPSLLAVCRHNQDRRAGPARVFEVGKVFLPRGGEPPEERWNLGLLDQDGLLAAADAIRRIEEALEFAGVRLEVRPAEQAPEAFDPAAACRIVRVRGMDDGERLEDTIGWAGLAAPALRAAFDLKQAPALAELNLELLAQAPSGPRRYRPLPQFPEVVRDVAVVVDEAVRWHDLESFAAEAARKEPLRDPAAALPRYLSTYRGKQLGAGRKSVAFSVVYRASARTLTDEEVNAAHGRFVEALLRRFNATLRQ
ncbi:MAG: phenylalanine--tRNA ligase subunit beta [Planctomycetota bacterium]|nr:phenylalanine--tRNA ligase subunit beta [Planctomycetota bacterium]